MQIWETLLSYALEQIKAANLPEDSWVLGGGTVLMFNFEHRISKDIDIFVNNSQLLTYITPRLNDTLEHVVEDYVEQTNFVRLMLDNGEIDFIHAPSLLNIPHSSFIFQNKYTIPIDSPAEIIAKKIKYRGDTFKPRDVFDLAVVCTHCKKDLMQHATYLKPYLDEVDRSIERLQDASLLEDDLQKIDILPNGKSIRGKEYEVCKQFINECRLESEKIKKKDCGRGR